MSTSPVKLRDVIERTLEYVVIGLMAGLATLVIVAVAFRQAGAALVWYDELASVLLAWLTYYGAALAALKRAHIGFPKFADSARPAVRRVLLFVREAVVLAFMVAVVWAGWRVFQILEGTTLVSLPWVPTRLTHSVIPVGAILFIAAELLNIPVELGEIREQEAESPAL